MKRPALQNKRVGVLPMAFRARKVFGTFEGRAPGDYNFMEHAKFPCEVMRCCTYLAELGPENDC